MYVEVKQILIVGYWFKRASSFRNCKCSKDEHYSVFHIISGIVSRENVWEGRSQSYFDSGNSELYKHPVWTKIYLSESKSKKLRLVLTVAVHLTQPYGIGQVPTTRISDSLTQRILLLNDNDNECFFIVAYTSDVVLNWTQGRGSHGAKAAVAHTKFRPMAPR